MTPTFPTLALSAIQCSERADYKWLCAKCGKEQGDHRYYILNPPAGDCEFVRARPKSGSAG